MQLHIIRQITGAQIQTYNYFTWLCDWPETVGMHAHKYLYVALYVRITRCREYAQSFDCGNTMQLRNWKKKWNIHLSSNDELGRVRNKLTILMTKSVKCHTQCSCYGTRCLLSIKMHSTKFQNNNTYWYLQFQVYN